MSERLRLGVDIGGTFTDAILISEESGEVWSDKVLTTPHDPSEGFLRVVQRVGGQSGRPLAGIDWMIHATTVATNAVIERRGATAGLLVTEGFRDILEIARQIRHELYNLQTDKPEPLIPRYRCVEVPERLDSRGQVLVPLDEEAAERAAAHLRDEGVDSVAICLLHSYRNPDHERRVAEIVRRVLPDARISVSSDIAPEIREYWRASTTVMNAYIAPTVGRYLDAVGHKLEAAGIDAPLYLMQSNGGITNAATARQRPVYLIESGPAAGVAVAAHFCELTAAPYAIAFDMGGTTAKMGLVTEGRSNVSSEFEVGAGWSGTPLTRGSGYPILGSVIDLVEVGAGGGSMAWIDSGGVLRVGPRSAGADPGPACYGHGGVEPTITDANLVLGRLDPAYFAGGELPLDAEAANAAIARVCGVPLGMDLPQAAMGIVDIANATMVQAVRLVSVQRGYYPRDFALVATGGAGPLHANALAKELGIPKVIVPPSPGVASALGMLVSDLRWEFRVTQLQPLDEADFATIDDAYLAMEEKALGVFLGEGIDRGAITLERYMEMRYIGQSWKLRVALGDASEDARGYDRLKERFDGIHEQTYGYGVPADPVEIVNVGLSAIGRIRKPQLRDVPAGDTAPDAALKGTRPVYFKETDGAVDCPVYGRSGLRVGNIVHGPAVIEETDSTTIVYPGYRATTAEHGTLLLTQMEA